MKLTVIKYHYYSANNLSISLLYVIFISTSILTYILYEYLLINFTIII